MKTFDEKIDYIRRFLFDVMKPSIEEMLRSYNKDETERWQGNCCRQTSLITNWYLRQWLLNNDSGYREIQSWHGIFSDQLLGERVRYDHAWIYCLHEDPEKNLLIDIARHHKPLLCIYTPVNQYPTDIPGYEHQRCTRKARLDEKLLWEQSEYFTDKKLKDLIPQLSRYLRRQGVMKQ